MGLSVRVERWGSAAARGVARFGPARDGATAVEFALVALPFFVLVGGCLENGLVFWQQEILQQAVIEASRQVYTGAFQTANAGIKDTATLLDRFRTSLCNLPNGAARTTIFDCRTVRVRIGTATDFQSAVPIPAVAPDAKGKSDWNPQFSSYSCGGASSIVVVQAAVDIPIFFTFPGTTPSDLKDNRRVIQSAAVFKVEPYSTDATDSVCAK